MPNVHEPLTVEEFLEVAREQADRPDLEFCGCVVPRSRRMSDRTRRQFGTVWRWYGNQNGKEGLYADFIPPLNRLMASDDVAEALAALEEKLGDFPPRKLDLLVRDLICAAVYAKADTLALGKTGDKKARQLLSIAKHLRAAANKLVDLFDVDYPKDVEVRPRSILEGIMSVGVFLPATVIKKGVARQRYMTQSVSNTDLHKLMHAMSEALREKAYQLRGDQTGQCVGDRSVLVALAEAAARRHLDAEALERSAEERTAAVVVLYEAACEANRNVFLTREDVNRFRYRAMAGLLEKLNNPV